MPEIREDEFRPKRFGRADAAFFIAAFVFIYTQLFALPFTPIYFEGDHLISVSNAMRMLQGEVIYRDFFHLTPPGTELIYESMFALFGVRVWILNAAIVALGVAQVWLLWFFARNVMSGPIVYLPAALFLAVGFRHFGIDGTYRLFSVVFVLAAAAVLMKDRSWSRLILAGCLCGISSFFVQTRGLSGIAGICVFLLWENYRGGFNLKALVKSGLYVGGPFLLTIAATHSYFAWQAGFENYYFSLVTFLRDHYPHDPLAKTTALFSDLPDFNSYLDVYSRPAAISRYVRAVSPTLFYYLLIPLIYIVYLIFRRVRRHNEGSSAIDARLVLLSSVGIFLAASVSAPTGYRLYHIAIPGLVIFGWLISRVSRSQQVAMAALVLLAVLGISYVVQRQVHEKVYLDLPAGEAAFLYPYIAERYQWIGKNVNAGETLYEAQHPTFYFPFHLKNPTPLYVVRDSNYTPAFQIDAVMAGLAKDPPRIIVWNGFWSKPPELREPGDNLAPLWEYIQTNYQLAVEFEDFGDYTLNSERSIQFWVRKD